MFTVPKKKKRIIEKCWGKVKTSIFVIDEKEVQIIKKENSNQY